MCALYFRSNLPVKLLLFAVLFSSKTYSQAYDVIASDGKSYYHYNSTYNVNTWTAALNTDYHTTDMIYLLPLNAAYMTFSDQDLRVYRFFERQLFSAYFSKETVNPVSVQDGVFTIQRNYAGDQVAKSEFIYNFFYPDNIEIISWKSECPSCRTTDWEHWQNMKGLLIFKATETSKVKLTVRYKLKTTSPEKTPNPEKIHTGDTVYIKKTDTVFIEKKHDPILAERKIDSVVNKETFETTDRKVTITVYDDGSVDDDIISVKLNDRVIISQLLLKGCKASFEVTLSPGVNTFTLIAENLGTIPPNTASFEVIGPNINKTIILRADKGSSESFTIISK